MTKREKLFEKETDLCAAFLSALPKGWTAYAETGGWDILLVRDADGFQIGVEAKLRLNAEVISQALEEYGTIGACSEGPDCRAVLVPLAESGSFDRIATYIGITVIRVSLAHGASFFAGKERPRKWDIDPRLPTIDDRWTADRWFEWCPTKRHRLPKYVPDVAAGSSAPVQLTEWKIRAIKIVILAEVQGYVTRADFKHIGIDHRRWISAEGWLRPSEERGRYVTHGATPTGFREQHPRVYEEIKAEIEEWRPPTIEAGKML
ncbi:hypothetical protein [Nitrobacter sp.]|uniref:hypothetical protein n=1 Tax=Nitrobacter sp. TaxID=29420 RepID=UPI0029CABBA8|nr:hypothetical protein [Nitrobacter sp.]